jgi:hypothetical protein
MMPFEKALKGSTDRADSESEPNHITPFDPLMTPLLRS